MRYITGILAFGVQCERNSTGKWNLTKSEFLDEKLMELKESDDYPFKDYGIEENKLIPYHDICTYNVADHVRAYVDMIYEKRFDELVGLFYECIVDMKCRGDIFMLVYGKLRHLAGFQKVNQFMTEEFGNAWLSYIDSVERVSEHIANSKDALEQIQNLHASMGKQTVEDMTKVGGLNAESVSTVPRVSLSGDSEELRGLEG